MERLLNLTMEAHNQERNHHRRYEVEVGKDLFDEWTVAIRYGRCGLKGQQKSFAAKDEGKLKQIIGERLKRRLSSSNRIDCRYRIVSLEKAVGIECDQWLPSDLIAKLI